MVGKKNPYNNRWIWPHAFRDCFSGCIAVLFWFIKLQYVRAIWLSVLFVDILDRARDDYSIWHDGCLGQRHRFAEDIYFT